MLCGVNMDINLIRKLIGNDWTSLFFEYQIERMQHNHEVQKLNDVSMQTEPVAWIVLFDDEARLQGEWLLSELDGDRNAFALVNHGCPKLEYVSIDKVVESVPGNWTLAQREFKIAGTLAEYANRSIGKTLIVDLAKQNDTLEEL